MFAVSLNKFMFLFSNYPQISYKILQYLDPQECLELSLTCKTLNSSVNMLVEQNLPQLKSLWMNVSSGSSGSEDEEEVKKEAEIAAKKKNKQKKNDPEKQKNRKWEKTTIFDLKEPQKTSLVSYKHFRPKNVDEFDSEIQQKFFKENQNLIFKNEQTNDLIVVHRSLVDKSLDFQMAVVQEGDSKYSEFFNADNNPQVSYDFSNPKALLERQKLLLENMKNKELEKEARMDVTPKLESLLKLKNITVILCHGGYFSIGIFDKMKPVFHKSDHKYVVRKKAGKRQITRDSNAGSNIQSMGSQIRRDQEKKHAENIKKILTEAYKLVKDSDIIFYHAPGYNRYLILDIGSPLFPLKDKFRSLCLTPKRANYTEVERIYNHLVKLYIIPANKQQ